MHLSKINLKTYYYFNDQCIEFCIYFFNFKRFNDLYNLYEYTRGTKI